VTEVFKPMGDSPRLRVWPAKTGLHAYAEAATPEEIHAVSLGLEFPWSRQGRPWAFTASIFPGTDVQSFIPGCRPPGAWKMLRIPDGEFVGEATLKVYDYGETPEVGLLWLQALASAYPIIYCPEGLAAPGVVIPPDLGLPWRTEADVQWIANSLATSSYPFQTIDVNDPAAISAVFGGVCFLPARYKFDPMMLLFLRRSAVRVPGFPKFTELGASLQVKGQNLI
jgi:hypothetical protein